MIAAGIDIGHQGVRVVFLEGGTILTQAAMVLAGSVDAAARTALERATVEAGLRPDQVGRIFVTGAGREGVPFAHGHPTEMLSHARGAHWLFPGARSVIDMGAEGIRILRCDAKGDLTGFVLNDKCASGTGVFLETVAGMLRISLAEMGPLSLCSTRRLVLTSTCAVFAESEIVAEIHRGASREDILWGVHDAIGAKIGSLSTRIGLEPQLILTGGVARNTAVVEALRRHIPLDMAVPQHPEMVGALGAAILAARAFEAERSACGDGSAACLTLNAEP
jgi:predicted CoA-substrate-specific enzyme activase